MKFEIEGILTALSPIHQTGDEKTGSTPVLRSINLYVESLGMEIPFPYISGNSVRGKNRRALIREFLEDLLGYEIKSPKIHHIFYTGGVLESTEETSGVIDLEFRRKVYQLIVPLAVFGTTIGNQALEGNLIVEHMWPICEEYAPYLPERFRNNPRCKKSIREFTGGAFLTRRDDLRAEREEDEQATQMKVDYEAFIPGTQFYHRWALKIANPLHISCLARIIELWREEPFIGGRSASGDGKLQLRYETPKDFSSQAYVDFIREHKGEILQLIAEMEARVK